MRVNILGLWVVVCVMAACSADSSLAVVSYDLSVRSPDMSVDMTTDTGEHLPDLSLADFACPTIRPGDIFWTGNPFMKYILTASGRYMYFPDLPRGDSSVLRSWFPDEKGLIATNDICFDKLMQRDSGPFAVNFRPGSYIIRRLAAQDKLYVVLPNYTRCAISKEDAQALYQSADPGGVDDTPVDIGLSEWGYLQAGPPIQGVRVHPGMLFQIDQDPLVFYVDKVWVVHQMTASGFSANHFQRRFVRRVPNAAVAGLTVGHSINSRVPEIDDPTQGL